jgi:elongation factor 1-beta
MGRVLTQIKVFPTEVGVDMKKLQNDIREGLPEGATIMKAEEEPIAFGLVALVLTISMIERDGIVEDVEKALASTANVGEIQTVAISRC